MATIREFTSNLFTNYNPDPTQERWLDVSIISPTISAEENYELLELYGDKVLQHMFCDYCMTTLGIDDTRHAPNIVSRLVIKHLSGTSLAKLCSKIGLSAYAKGLGDQEKLREDVMEAWTGACTKVYGFLATLEVFKTSVFVHIDVDLEYCSLYCPRTILNDLRSMLPGKFEITNVPRANSATKEFRGEYVDDDVKISCSFQSADWKIASKGAAEALLSKMKGEIDRFEDRYLCQTGSYTGWKNFIDNYSGQLATRRNVQDIKRLTRLPESCGTSSGRATQTRRTDRPSSRRLSRCDVEASERSKSRSEQRHVKKSKKGRPPHRP